LSGCGSSPATHYYTLSAVPEQVASRPSGQNLAIGRITVAKTLDRPQIARRLGSNELEFAEFDRWASGLDDQIRHALAEDLSAELGTIVAPSVSASPAPTTQIIDIAFDRFEADRSGTISLVARWSDGMTGSQNRQEREEIVTSPSEGGDSTGVAAAMSKAVATLAHRIATSLPKVPN
jgi:uncharacterized lipoprotein YmbA